ncbi:Arylsulfatase [Pontiella sulfatireligans]|uniref:Arylsulfatase n=2 Tax=Pontiella sulfatireligans TaxID=2750658 RepID=A0A6C2ULG9_9BACT|nr:sulfatase S1_7 [Kiritimatiellales bacterium]VGO20819.1 Arylsulfatase [Pontiella sulfatireligans]
MGRDQVRRLLGLGILLVGAMQATPRPNVLFIISDDLTATALSCYENKACQTPNIDRLAAQGTRYTRTFCQFPVCGPSRASFMSGYYPHATGSLGYNSGRQNIGDRATWSQHFINNGYHAARVSKIYHMGVPGDIVKGSNGTDDEASWVERFNSQGPEVMAPGDGERLEGNPDGTRGYGKGNHLEYVKAEGGDEVHSDGKTAKKACELLREYKGIGKPFFLAVGFVRPHVPFVSPRAYYEPYDWDNIVLPEKVAGDWDDIPKAGINYRTSKGMQLTTEKEKKAIAAYYASVAFMDAQVGKVLDTLREEGLEENTIVIFTSDHGFHLCEHDFWMKVGLMDESSRVPLIIKVPGKKPAVCNSFTELLDLYPTVSELCGLEVPSRLQGKSLVQTLDDPSISVRDAAFCVNKNSYLLRTDEWAYIQHGKNGELGLQLFDMKKDPKQYTNLAENPEYASVVARFKKQLGTKLKELSSNDLADVRAAKAAAKKDKQKKKRQIGTVK